MARCIVRRTACHTQTFAHFSLMIGIVSMQKGVACDFSVQLFSISHIQRRASRPVSMAGTFYRRSFLPRSSHFGKMFSSKFSRISCLSVALKMTACFMVVVSRSPALASPICANQFARFFARNVQESFGANFIRNRHWPRQRLHSTHDLIPVGCQSCTFAIKF